MNLEPLGDSAVVATLGSRIDAATLGRVRRFAAAVAAGRGRGIVDVVPAYATVTTFYDPACFTESGEDAYESVRRFLERCASGAGSAVPVENPRLVELPVVYGGEGGRDLDWVAHHCGMDPAQVIAAHVGVEYVVHAIGFSPGFPYLGGLPDSLRAPRRETPRPRVPAGSVGIGGAQTGVYPLESPGGWRLIGRTPVALFRPDRTPSALLRVGDRVRFRAVTQSESETWR
jgi:inhibitor of KinA